MKAITLIRPMSAAIVHGTKRIENRPKNLPKLMLGVRTVVAVHAGKGWDPSYSQTLIELDGKLRYTTTSQFTDEGIVGLMLLGGRVFTHRDVRDYDTCSPQRDNNDYDIRREYLLDGVKVATPSSWYSGPFGYEILSAVAFPGPMPCRGMLGFWTMPAELEAAISDSGAIDDLYAAVPA